MKLIKIISDFDFGIVEKSIINPRTRLGARGIIFNDKNQIAIINKKYKNEYKLVGGGIEENETPEESFLRESLEETGCVIKIDKTLGVIKEYKSQDNFKQISTVFLARVIKDTKRLNLTDKEKSEGTSLIWLEYEKAMKAIKESEDKLISSKYESVYHTKFIVRRDYEILKYYKDNYL